MIQAMIEVNVEVWDDFLLDSFYNVLCNELIIIAVIKKQKSYANTNSKYIWFE